MATRIDTCAAVATVYPRPVLSRPRPSSVSVRPIIMLHTNGRRRLWQLWSPHSEFSASLRPWRRLTNRWRSGSLFRK